MTDLIPTFLWLLRLLWTFLSLIFVAISSVLVFSSPLSNPLPSSPTIEYVRLRLRPTSFASFTGPEAYLPDPTEKVSTK
jgi:hypothetical protein